MVRFLYFSIFLYIIGIDSYLLLRILKDQNNSLHQFYYIFITGSLIFLIISLIFFFNQRHRINYLFTIISTVACLYLVEFFLSFNFTNNDFRNNNFDCKGLEECDSRSKFDFYNDSVNNNIDILPSYNPNELNRVGLGQGIEFEKGNYIFPLSFVGNKLTIVCNEIGQWETYKTDKYGFNNSNNDYNKNIDFIILGDSYVWGECSKRDENIDANLSELLKLNIINFGIGGSGPLHMLGIISEYVINFQPHHVIWFHFQNDLRNLQLEEFGSFMNKYLYEKNFTQNLINRDQDINSAITNYINFYIEKNEIKFFNFHIYSFIKLTYVRKLVNLENNLKYIYNVFVQNKKNKEKNYTVIEPETYVIYEEILDKSVKILKEKNINITFVYLPDLPEIFPFEENVLDDNKEKVINIWKKNNLQYIDASEVLNSKNFKKNELFHGGFWGNHYTSKGYRVLSKYLYNKIDIAE